MSIYHTIAKKIYRKKIISLMLYKIQKSMKENLSLKRVVSRSTNVKQGHVPKRKIDKVEKQISEICSKTLVNVIGLLFVVHLKR